MIPAALWDALASWAHAPSNTASAPRPASNLPAGCCNDPGDCQEWRDCGGPSCRHAVDTPATGSALRLTAAHVSVDQRSTQPIDPREEVIHMEIGDSVIYVDPQTVEHSALVTAVHGGERPSLNLVYVSDDPFATDQYGRQLATRVTSIVHQSRQYAHGSYWREPEVEIDENAPI